MDAPSLIAQTSPVKGGLPSVRAADSAQSLGPAQFLSELFKLIAAPVADAGNDEVLSEEPAEAVENGAELPPGGDVLPLAPPIFGITQLSPRVEAAATNAAASSEQAALPPSVVNLVSGLLPPKPAPGAATTRPADVTDTAPAETLLEASAGDVLELATAAAIETPEFQRAVEAAIQQLAERASQPPVQVSATDSGQDQAIPPSSFSTGATGRIASGTSAEPTPVFEMSVPFGEAEWDSSVAERVLWMVREQTQTATIRLNPPGLGPLNVTIQVQDDQATVQFHAAHVGVREALDVAVPRLREMLAEAGVSLAGVNISGQGAVGQGGDFAHDASPPAPRSTRAHRAGALDEPVSTVAIRLNQGLIDFYA